MENESEKSKTGHLKKKDLGIAGLALVLSQFGSSLQGTDRISREISQFKDEFHQSILEREQFFVRKTDLLALNGRFDRLDAKLDALTLRVSKINIPNRSTYQYEPTSCESVEFEEDDFPDDELRAGL